MEHSNTDISRLTYTFWQQYHSSIHKVWENGKLDINKDKSELRYQPKEISSLDQYIYVKNGVVAIISHEKRILVKHGICCFIPAGAEFALYPENTNDATSYYILSFSTVLTQEALSFISRKPKYYYLTPRGIDPFVLTEGNQCYLQERFDIFMHKSLGVELIETHILIPSLNILIYDLTIIAFFSDQRKAISALQMVPPWLRTLCSQMKKPKHFSRGMKEMERLSGKTANSLYHIFVNYLNITPLDFVNDQKSRYAAEKLSQTDQNIIDIAYDIGFSSVSYFYRFFKKYHMVSPAAYRTAARQPQNAPVSE